MTEIDEKGENITKKISSYDNLLVAQVLWQAHYQVFSINFLKELIILNEDMDTMIENVNFLKLLTKYATVFLNAQMLKMI